MPSFQFILLLSTIICTPCYISLLVYYFICLPQCCFSLSLKLFFILPEKKDNILIVGGLAEPRCSFSIFMTERCARNCFHTPSYFISSSSSLKYKFICLFFLSTLWSVSFSTMMKWILWHWAISSFDLSDVIFCVIWSTDIRLVVLPLIVLLVHYGFFTGHYQNYITSLCSYWQCFKYSLLLRFISDSTWIHLLLQDVL